MKRHIHRWVMLVIVCVPVWVGACDICGCAGGGNSMGLLPLVPRHFIGLRWQTQRFDTDAHGSEVNSNETFHNFDIWGRWQAQRRLQVIGALPYLFTTRRFADGSSFDTRGFGDASVLAQFALLDPSRQSACRWRHALQLGAGAKLPTGRTDLKNNEKELLSPNLQPGTGSTDLQLSALYAIRHGAWGVSADASAWVNGKGANAYQAGNRLSASVRGFWTKTWAGNTLLPYAGVSLDARDADRLDDKWQADSGGWAAFALCGAEIFRNNLALSANIQLPLANELSGGQVHPQARFSVSAAVLLGNKNKAAQVNAPDVFSNAKK